MATKKHTFPMTMYLVCDSDSIDTLRTNHPYDIMSGFDDFPGIGRTEKEALQAAQEYFEWDEPNPDMELTLVKATFEVVRPLEVQTQGVKIF